MKFKFRHDNNYRRNYYKYELKHRITNSVKNHNTFPFVLKFIITNFLGKEKNLSQFLKVRNRCVFTIRVRSVFSSYKVSRTIFRQRAITGQIVGIKKSVW
nr:ribosomal protein S14 [Cyanidioschyzonaceae sp. 1 FvB-2021]